jgi:hypothetical protein
MDFSKDFFKCAYEVGRGLEHKECWKEFMDMRECELSVKTVSVTLFSLERSTYMTVYYMPIYWL